MELAVGGSLETWNINLSTSETVPRLVLSPNWTQNPTPKTLNPEPARPPNLGYNISTA